MNRELDSIYPLEGRERIGGAAAERPNMRNGGIPKSIETAWLCCVHGRRLCRHPWVNAGNGATPPDKNSFPAFCCRQLAATNHGPWQSDRKSRCAGAQDIAGVNTLGARQNMSVVKEINKTDILRAPNEYG